MFELLDYDSKSHQLNIVEKEILETMLPGEKSYLCLGGNDKKIGRTP